jgi:murein tripeptide amidase MpaA
MVKPDSQYNAGMQPLAYSVAGAAQGEGWHRVGYDVCYYANVLKKKAGGYYYSLEFKIKFEHEHDTVYLAHSYPYTFTDLSLYLSRLEQKTHLKPILQRRQLCQTALGNPCDYLMISEFNNGKEKRGIVLTSRVHPGESMTSHIIEAIIDYLLGDAPEARMLRQNFIFKVVPMLNIDGVIHGNYRTDLQGVDLNRVWVDPQKKQHPTIYATKSLIRKTR